jgi:hypothetical protein
MKTPALPETTWKKEHLRPCPGKCGHPHVGKRGPCTKTGCGCYATGDKKK